MTTTTAARFPIRTTIDPINRAYIRAAVRHGANVYTPCTFAPCAELSFPMRAYEHFAYDYGSGRVYVRADGSVVWDVQGRTSSGHEADRHRIVVVNLESWHAWKTEVAYVDREHRFPGENPNRAEWHCINA